MNLSRIENTVRRIADEYDIEVYDVFESGGTVVIEQDELEDTKFALLAAMLFDQYNTGFGHIEIRASDTEEVKRVSRGHVQEGLKRFAELIGTKEDFEKHS